MKSPSGPWNRFYIGLSSTFLLTYVRLMSVTSRWTLLHFDRLERAAGDGKYIIWAAWNGIHLAGLCFYHKYLRPYGAVSFVTADIRGQTLVPYMRKLGMDTIDMPLAPDRAGRKQALFAMRDKIQEGRHCVIAVDGGGHGPARIAKPGALVLAQVSHAALFPMGVAARPGFHLEKRWDNHLIPLPFGHIAVAVGEPVEVPPDLERIPQELCLELQKRINNVMTEAEAAVR